MENLVKVHLSRHPPVANCGVVSQGSHAFRCPKSVDFRPLAQLFSDPGKKGTLFWEDHLVGQPPKKRRKKGATEQPSWLPVGPGFLGLRLAGCKTILPKSSSGCSIFLGCGLALATLSVEQHQLLLLQRPNPSEPYSRC